MGHTVAKTASRVISVSTFWPVVVSLSFFLLMFVILHVLQIVVEGAWALAWISYIAFGSGVSFVRTRARNLLPQPTAVPKCCLQMEMSTREEKNAIPGEEK